MSQPQSLVGVPIVPVSDVSTDCTSPPSPGVDRKTSAAHVAAFDSGFISSASGGFTSGGFTSGEVDDFSGDAIDRSADRAEPATIDAPPSSPPAKSAPTLAYVDSGLCDDADVAADDDDDNNVTSDTASSSMHVDAMSSAKEWTCSGSQRADSNNLASGQLASGDAKQSRYPDPMVLKEYMALWKVCYIQDENGDTQLHLSILSKMTKAITNIIRLAPQKLLLDLRNDDGQSGLHYAVLTSQPHVIRQLRAAGAKPSVRDHCGNTPLHLACINNDLSCVQALTNPITADEQLQFPYAERIPLLPADTQYHNYDGEYCVHIAAQRGYVDILRHLVIACGADVNVREGRAGYTALHIACENRNAAVLDFLLTECAAQLQLETCTYGRLTAYQLAGVLSDQRALDALRRCGAQPLEPMSDTDDSDSDDDFSSDETPAISYCNEEATVVQ